MQTKHGLSRLIDLAIRFDELYRLIDVMMIDRRGVAGDFLMGYIVDNVAGQAPPPLDPTAAEAAGSIISE